jgi:hypothetical protein
MLNGLLLKEPQTERREHQDNSDVHYRSQNRFLKNRTSTHDGYQRST